MQVRGLMVEEPGGGDMVVGGRRRRGVCVWCGNAATMECGEQRREEDGDGCVLWRLSFGVEVLKGVRW